ncbi:glucose 1-dehydrogenase [candidate division KSB1 bacterium]
MPLQKLFSLEGKTALVTGASRGIGRAIAAGLAQAGADVAINATTVTNLRKVTDDIEAAGQKALPLPGDIGDLDLIDQIVERCESEWGRIDILVNNAGVSKRLPAEDFPPEEWDRILDINLRAAFFLCQRVGTAMLRNGSGKIINIASLLSFSGGLYVPAYAAAKGGLLLVTRALANEWASRGVNVNAVAPGYIRTDLTEKLFHDNTRKPDIDSRIPAGRWGEPGDLVGAILFLASAASDYVHGEVIMVDGGWSAR